jgi:hypothetical protein
VKSDDNEYDPGMWNNKTEVNIKDIHPSAIWAKEERIKRILSCMRESEEEIARGDAEAACIR